MIKQTLALGMFAMFAAALAANATCVSDPPEIGDTGPASELVCSELERRFPGSAIAVEGRSVHSPTEVSMIVSVDGAPVRIDYELSGYSWRLDDDSIRTADTLTPQADLSMRR